ncbi:50S ribosomal protein L29 [uncultured archaeon]|nr:50S ribosomal protein L29 [uncultured archaeon]
MAQLKSTAIREMSDDDMSLQITELKKQYMKIKGALKSGGVPEDVGKARILRRNIARILTIQKQKAHGEVKKTQK